MKPWEADEPHEVLWPQLQSLCTVNVSRETYATESRIQYYGNSKHGTVDDVKIEDNGSNVIQTCVDTLAAQVLNVKVRPMFLTDGGDVSKQAQAQGMQRAVEAAFQAAGLYDGPSQYDANLAYYWCYDGLMYDCGLIKIVPNYRSNKPQFSRVLPWNLMVDSREAQYGAHAVRQFWEKQVVDRDVLLGMMRDAPKRVRDAIKDAPNVHWKDRIVSDTMGPHETTDQIMVGSYWHLPSWEVEPGEDDHDGMYCLYVEGATLDKKPWCYDYAPFAQFKPYPYLDGYWSRSTAELLRGDQLTLAKMRERIDTILHLHANPRTYLWDQAGIDPKKLTNSPNNVYKTSCQPSQAVHVATPASVSSEYLQREERYIRQSKEKVGLSDTSIAANKPAGIEHGPALMFLQDTETIRHSPVFKAWERAFVHAARITVDVYRALVEEKPVKVVFRDNQSLQEVDWKEVDLGSASSQISVWPSNLLPQQPGARISRVMTLMQMGLFSPEEAKTMLDFPDIKAFADDAVAARDNIERRLEKLMGGGSDADYGFVPHLNLELAIQISKNKINRLEASGENEERIAPLRTFFEDAMEQMAKAQAPQQAAPAAPEVTQ